MTLRDAREERQNIIDGHFKINHGTRVTALNKIFKVLVLLNEFFLHRVPHNLNEKKKTFTLHLTLVKESSLK